MTASDLAAKKQEIEKLGLELEELKRKARILAGKISNREAVSLDEMRAENVQLKERWNDLKTRLSAQVLVYGSGMDEAAAKIRYETIMLALEAFCEAKDVDRGFLKEF